MDEHTARQIDEKAEPATAMLKAGIISPLARPPANDGQDLMQGAMQTLDNVGEEHQLGIGTFLINLMSVLRIILHSFALMVEVLVHYRFGLRAVSPAVVSMGVVCAFLIVGLSSGWAGIVGIFGLMFMQAFTVGSMGFLYFVILGVWGYQWYLAKQHRSKGGQRHSFSSGQPLLYHFTKNEFFLTPLFLVFIEPVALIIVSFIFTPFLVPSICLFLRNVIDNYLLNNAAMNAEDNQIESKYQQALSSQNQALLDDAIKAASLKIEQGETLEPHIVEVIAEKGTGKAKAMAEEQKDNFVVG